MGSIDLAFKHLHFKWLPKHINHIAENIVYKKRNVSFLSMIALFRQKNAEVTLSETPFANSYVLSGFVPLQQNDRLRTKAEKLSVIFRLDDQNNIIPITSYSESDAE